MQEIHPKDDTAKLLMRVERGERGAIDHLFERHRAGLRRMVAARMDNRLARRVDASDVVQETIVEAYRQLPQYLQSRAVGFYPWLRQIGVNRLKDLHRKHVVSGKRTVDREVNDALHLSADAVHNLTHQFISREPDPAARIVENEAVVQLREAISRLAPNELEIIVLRHVEQLSVVEISDVLGIATGTVKSRHYRTLVRLREILQTLAPET